MTDLHEHLDAAPDGTDLDDEEVRERWRIDSDELATWAGRKLAKAEGERKRIEQIAHAERQKITDWERDAIKAAAHDEAFFRSRLIAYRLDLEANDPNLAGTYKLPTVTLTRRQGRMRTLVTNPEQFLSWALENRVSALKIEPLVSGLADLTRTDEGLIVDDSGEVVPGVEEHRGDDTYAAKPVDLWLGEPF